MRHLNKGRKLKRTSSHRKALLNNLATALFEHKKIITTEAKAKELRPFAEQLITRAKHAYQNENAKQLPDGQTIDIHNRRIVSRYIKRKAVLQELFDAIAPVIAERPGGYCRIIKVGNRRGDGGKSAIIELVDWSNPVDGASSIKKRKKQKVATSKHIEAPKVAPKVAKEENNKVEVIEDIEETVATQEVENISTNEINDSIPIEIVADSPVEDFEEEVKVISKTEEKSADEQNKDNA